MSESIIKLFETGGGELVSPPSVFIDKLKKIKAILFDWDGVFNDGFKRGSEGSIFSEVDAMGTNLLRYALWKSKNELPITAVITGERNPLAHQLAEREHFHEVFFQSKNKGIVFTAFCAKYNLKPKEVLFFFDDVLDLEVARLCGASIMIGRPASPMLKKFSREAEVADYITACDGGRHGLREGCELVVGLLGMFDDVVKNRSTFSENYRAYLGARQKVTTGLVEQKLS